MGQNEKILRIRSICWVQLVALFARKCKRRWILPVAVHTATFCLLKSHPSNQRATAHMHATIKLKVLSKYLHGCFSNDIDLHAQLTHTYTCGECDDKLTVYVNRMHQVMGRKRTRRKIKCKDFDAACIFACKRVVAWFNARRTGDRIVNTEQE